MSDQVDAFEGRDVVVVRNAFVKMTGGFMKLEFNQWGKVSIRDCELKYLQAY